MINKIKSMLLFSLMMLFVVGCDNNDEDIDPSSSVPVISSPYESITADLNTVDNLPIVAIIKSEAGLKNVTLSIITTDDVTTEIENVSEFFNKNNFSLTVDAGYENNFKSALIIATDKLDRVERKELPITIIDVVDPPVIVFDPERIEYDERIGGDLPNTKFTATSSVGLAKIERILVTEEGQTAYGNTLEFSNGELEYVFDEFIQYSSISRAFIVKVYDVYDKVKISTLPVIYKAVPPPTVTFVDEVVIAAKEESKTIDVNIESFLGVSKVEVYTVDGDIETIVQTEIFATPEDKKEFTFTTNAITFKNSTSGVKIIATDMTGKVTTETVGALVNLVYEKELKIATHRYVEYFPLGYDDVYSLFSIKDLRTYQLSECLASDEASKNVDIKLYCFNSGTTLRFYSISGGTNTKSNEFKDDGKTVMQMGVQNETLFQKITIADFDFETATVADIEANIKAADITSTGAMNFKMADVYAFKTASTSSLPDKIGLIRVVSEIQTGQFVVHRVVTFDIKYPKE